MGFRLPAENYINRGFFFSIQVALLPIPVCHSGEQTGQNIANLLLDCLRNCLMDDFRESGRIVHGFGREEIA